MLDFAVEDALVGAFVLLLEALDAEDGLVGGSVRPYLESSSLHGEVLEAFVPFYGGDGVSPDLEHAKDGLLLAAGPFVAWLVRELGSLSPRLERCGFPIPSLKFFCIIKKSYMSML